MGKTVKRKGKQNVDVDRMVRDTNRWIRSKEGQKEFANCMLRTERILAEMAKARKIDRSMLTEPMTI